MALRRVGATIGLADLDASGSTTNCVPPKKGLSGFRARAGDAVPGPHAGPPDRFLGLVTLA